MAEQWEQIFKGFGEKTYTIAQLIQNANEGDDLSEPLKVCLSSSEPADAEAHSSMSHHPPGDQTDPR
jgi:hypothetical protein